MNEEPLTVDALLVNAAFQSVMSILRLNIRPCFRSLGSLKFNCSITTSKKYVKTSFVDDIGVIIMSDPKRLNALTCEMGKEFTESVYQMREAAEEQRIRACILMGEGESFSAGGDLKWLRQRHKSSAYANNLTMLNFYESFLCIRKIPVPTVAAIHGSAIGAGAALTLACDIRIASPNSKIGFTFVKIGIHPGMGSSILLPKVVGQGMATSILLKGNILNGLQAKDAGLVTEIVEDVRFQS